LYLHLRDVLKYVRVFVTRTIFMGMSHKNSHATEKKFCRSHDDV